MANNDHAVEIINRAFQGDAASQYEFGMSLILGGKKDGVEWVEKAACNGWADAQNSLGVMYANGEWVIRNMTKAEEWLQKAAKQGHEEAQRNLNILRGR
jgi:TPR repeat protein